MKENYTKDEIFEIETILRSKLIGTSFDFSNLDIQYEDNVLFREDGKDGESAYKISFTLLKDGILIEFCPKIFTNKVDVFDVADHILFDLYGISENDDKNIIYDKLPGDIRK